MAPKSTLHHRNETGKVPLEARGEQKPNKNDHDGAMRVPKGYQKRATAGEGAQKGAKRNQNPL